MSPYGGRKVVEKWARGQQGPDHEGLRGSGLNPPNLKSMRSNSLLPRREVLCDFEQGFLHLEYVGTARAPTTSQDDTWAK